VTASVERGSRAAIAASYAYAAVAAACLGYFLLGIPIQLTDSFGNMLQLTTTWPDLMERQFYQRAFLRPFLWAELKLVHDLSGGNYFAWFRGVHVAQIVVLVLMYVQLVRPVTWRDAALIPLGLAALIGGHTFQGTVTEAFPINTFLTIVLCCVATANLAVARHRWWTDVLAVALFVIAALTVESGLLVWVILVSAALAGARGVSRGAIAVATALLAGYFVLRFWWLDVGSPSLSERASGFGFGVLEPGELIERFGENPIGFYAYNVAASLLSVLFAEPRSGVFRVAQGIAAGEPSVAGLVTMVAVSLGTFVIAAYAWQRRREWIARRGDRGDIIVLMFVAVLVANSAISYPYTKDVVMSPAGALFAAALFVAARHTLFRWSSGGPLVLAGAVVLAVALSTTWAVRDVGTHLNLRARAYKVRNEWSYVNVPAARPGQVVDPSEERLLRLLKDDAILAHPAPPRLALADLPLFDID
jgi:hypothetical protein